MKTHLTYRVDGEVTGAAYCGNNGRGYKYGLRVAMPKEFRKVSPDARCAHCELIYMKNRNLIRRKKGLPPVSSPFEGQDSE